MNYSWSRDQVMPGAWKTPDGSNIISAETTSKKGRIVVRTDSGKTYFVPKRYTNRLRINAEWMPVVAARGDPKTIRVKL